MEVSGSAIVADAFVDRIRSFCEQLTLFPERGTRRDDIAPGLRTMGFERRATIVFAVQAETVVILRVHFAGQAVRSPFA